MGVHGLWELLLPVGKRVDSANASRKVVAVDVSIWISQFVQAMRDADGAMVRNAHLLGILRRCCKLLFLGVKPIFVFDGGTPALKRRTLAQRRTARDMQASKVRRLAEKMLMNKLKNNLLSAHAAGKIKPSKNQSRDQNMDASPTKSSSDQRHGITDVQASTTIRTASTGEYGSVEYLDYSEIDFEASTRPHGEQGYESEGEGDEASAGLVLIPEDLHQIDDNEIVKLPPELQSEVFKQIRIQQRSQHREQVLGRKSDPAAFSRAQIDGFLQNTALNRKISQVRTTINDRSGASRRIASDNAREYELKEGKSEDEFDDSSDEENRTGRSCHGQSSTSNEAKAAGVDDVLKQIRLDNARRGKETFRPGDASVGPTQVSVGTKDNSGVAWASKVLEDGGALDSKNTFGDVGRHVLDDGTGDGKQKVSARERLSQLRRRDDDSEDDLDRPLFNDAGPRIVSGEADLKRNATEDASRNGAVPVLVENPSEESDDEDWEEGSIDQSAGVEVESAKVLGSSSRSQDAERSAGDSLQAEHEQHNAKWHKDDENLQSKARDVLTAQRTVVVSTERGEHHAHGSSEREPKKMREQAPGDALQSPKQTDVESGVVEPLDGTHNPSGQSTLLSEASKKGAECTPNRNHSKKRSFKDAQESARKAYSIAFASKLRYPIVDSESAQSGAHRHPQRSHPESDAVLQASPEDLRDSEGVADGETARVRKRAKIGPKDVGSHEEMNKQELELRSPSVPAQELSEGANVRRGAEVSLSSEVLPSTSDGYNNPTQSSDSVHQHQETRDSEASERQNRDTDHGTEQNSDRQAPPSSILHENVSENATEEERDIQIAIEASLVDAKEQDQLAPVVDRSSNMPASPSDDDQISPAKGESVDSLRGRRTAFLEKEDNAEARNESSPTMDAGTTDNSVHRAASEVRPLAFSEVNRLSEEEISMLQAEIGGGDTELQSSVSPFSGSNEKQSAPAYGSTEAITDEMYTEARELLRLLGLPYLVAPMEAEAQCAFLNKAGIVDAVLTEDSDAFLFGARVVYRRLFMNEKFAEMYDMDAIEDELGVDRERLIRLALLLGSDYTSGVRGVGIVNSMEILEAFPGEDGLHEFKAWAGRLGILDEPVDTNEPMDSAEAKRKKFCWKHRNMKRNWEIHPSFPNDAVMDAYRNPEVDHSERPFTWNAIDVDGIRQFCWQKFGWSRPKVDETIGPVLKKIDERKRAGPRQTHIEDFFKPYRFAKIRSERLQQAVKGIAGEKATHLLANDGEKAKPRTGRRQHPMARKRPGVLDGSDDMPSGGIMEIDGEEESSTVATKADT